MKFISAVFAIILVGAALFFIACYLIIREVSIFIMRELHQARAAKSAQG